MFKSKASNIDKNNNNNCNLENFKGIYFNQEEEQKFYEAGAHFKYSSLCKILEKIVTTLPNERKGKSLYEDWPTNSEKLTKRIDPNKPMSNLVNRDSTSTLEAKLNCNNFIIENNKVTIF